MKRRKKKPFTERNSEVLCANDRCAMVNGREGVVRMPIKQNVIDRAPEGQSVFYCYYCSIWEKTGLTRKQVLAQRAKRRGKKVGPKVLTAGEEA